MLIGGKRSRREATPLHPFSYGREQYVYAFLVSIVLFTRRGLSRRARHPPAHAALGPEELLIGATLAVGRQEYGHQVAAAIEAAEQRARDAVPGLRLVMHLEPDVDWGDSDLRVDLLNRLWIFFPLYMVSLMG